MWTYQDQPYQPAEDHVGFCYRITRLDTGRMYIGKKNLVKKVTRPPLKGKTRKRRSTAESDWRSYFGSNETLRDEVLQLGQHHFKREVIRPCRSKGEMSYWETKYQLAEDVLLHPELYYNEFVGCKIHRSHVKSMSKV